MTLREKKHRHLILQTGTPKFDRPFQIHNTFFRPNKWCFLHFFDRINAAPQRDGPAIDTRRALPFQLAAGPHCPNAFVQTSEQILRHPYGLSSKLQPFELRLQLAFTGHFLLPSGASVRLTIVVICTAACSLFCSPRFRRYAFPPGRGDERRRWRIQRIESVPNHRVQQVINVVGRQ